MDQAERDVDESLKRNTTIHYYPRSQSDADTYLLKLSRLGIEGSTRTNGMTAAWGADELGREWLVVLHHDDVR